MLDVGILGLGLMGGSIAKALRQRDNTIHIAAVDPCGTALEHALRQGVIDEGSSDPMSLAGSRLIVLAAPVNAILEWLRNCGPAMPAGTIIVDTGSTKRRIVEEMKKLPAALHCLGGHPMAGKETSGFEAADGTLLEGATFFLTPLPSTPPAALDEVRAFVERLGARPVITEAALHDSMTAASSHLPYLAAAALALSAEESLEQPGASSFFSSGFRDTSRLAAQDTAMTMAICTSNRDMLAARLRGFLREAEGLLALLEQQDDEALQVALNHAREVRRRLYAP